MTTNKMRWLLVDLVSLALWPAPAIGQGALRDGYNEAGLEALEQGRYAEADKQLLIALEEAQGFDREDPRLAATLSNLANI